MEIKQYRINRCLGILFFMANVVCVYAQKIPAPPAPLIGYSINTVEVTNENGLDVHRIKKGNKLMDGVVSFTLYDDGGGNQFGFSGDNLRFVNGLRDKRWNIFSVDNWMCYVINYNKGLITGQYKVYFEYYKPIKKKDGSLSNIKCDTTMYETNFVDGNGIWKDFYRNGNIREIGQVKSGKREGEWLHYFRGNILYKKKYYQEGVLIKEEDIPLPEGYQREVLY